MDKSFARHSGETNRSVMAEWHMECWSWGGYTHPTLITRIPMKKLMLLLAGVLALGAVSARATLIGQVITATDPREGLNKTAALDGSVQFKDNGQTLGFAFGADTLTVTNLFNFNNNWAAFGPLTFSGFTTPITGITLASNNGFSGTILSPTFTNTSIIFNMSSGSAANGSARLVFDIHTASPSVSESGATGVMFGFVILGLATLARKGRIRGVTLGMRSRA